MERNPKMEDALVSSHKLITYYTDEPEKSEEIRPILNRILVRDEDILAIVRSDISRNGVYNDEYLIVTNKRIFVISIDGQVLKELNLREVKSASIRPYLGVCALVVNTDNGSKTVVVYSKRRKSAFEKVVTLINDMVLLKIPTNELKSTLRQYLSFGKRPQHGL